MKKIVLFFVIFSANSYSAVSEEMCVHSHKLMHMYHLLWQNVADNLFLQSKTVMKKPFALTRVNRNDNNHCLTVEGDEHIISRIQELYLDSKKDIPVPLNSEIKDIQVEVYLSSIKEPLLSLPGMSSNVIYDVDKNPVTISARMVHPLIIEFTYGSFTNNFHLDEVITCIKHTKDDLGKRDRIVQPNGIVMETNFENQKSKPHFYKQGNALIELNHISFRATLTKQP